MSRRSGASIPRCDGGGVRPTPPEKARPMARAVERWFEGAARPLPWRTDPRDPYRSLVSEFMLQQTQVARVLEKFGPFIERFPSAATLARASEQTVLGMWSGLGYYRRARLLHAAARAIVRDHGGAVPRDAAALRELPGIGRYTAGAVASIVFGAREPIVDGNVARVLLRVHGRELAASDPEAAAWAWERAGELVRAAERPGALNEGLMELGAVVCTARSPRCGSCPLARSCAAGRDGTAAFIPIPRRAGPRRTLSLEAAVVRDARGRVLMQRRDPDGMWASMWQVPTLERAGPGWSSAEAGRRLAAAFKIEPARVVGRFVHSTSHRVVRVRVWTAAAGGPGAGVPGFAWKSPADRLGISNLQRKVLELASGRDAGVP